MKGFKIANLRLIVALIGVGVIVGGTFAEKAIGTYCNLCPVGFLQITVASRTIPVDMLVGVAIGFLLIFIFARFFCAWLCTTAIIKRVGLGSSNRLSNTKTKKNTHKDLNNKISKSASKLRIGRYAPYIVLTVALVASFIVKFPVFCLICPIGLFFGLGFAVFKLFHVYDPSWNLLIFPAILFIELLLFRRWCSYICPISGIFTLIRKIPLPKFLLQVDSSTCLQTQGVACKVCFNSCVEKLTIAKPDSSPDNLVTERCTLCLECKEHCPTASINFTQTADKQVADKDDNSA